MVSHPNRSDKRLLARSGIRPYQPSVSFEGDFVLNCLKVVDLLVEQLSSEYDRIVESYLRQQDRRRSVRDISFRENQLDLELFTSSKWTTKTGQVATLLLVEFKYRVPQRLHFVVDHLNSNVGRNSSAAIKLANELDLASDPIHRYRVKVTGESLFGYDWSVLPLPLRIHDPLKSKKPARKVFRRGYSDKGSSASISAKAVKSANRVHGELVDLYEEIRPLVQIGYQDHLNFDEMVDMISEVSRLRRSQIISILQIYHESPELFK